MSKEKLAPKVMTGFSNIRTKIVAAVVTIFALLISVILTTFDGIIGKEFENLERSRSLTDQERVTNTINAEAGSLATQGYGWAIWDETYDFVSSPASSYIEQNLSFAALGPSRIKHVLIFNASGEPIYGVEIDQANGTASPASTALLERLARTPLTTFKDRTGFTKGVLVHDDAPLVMTGVAIQDNAQSKPVVGTMVFTKEIDDSLLSLLSERTMLSLKLHVVRSGSLQAFPVVEHDGVKLSLVESGAINTDDSDFLFAAVGLRDIFNEAAIVLSFKKPRDIYQQGLRTRNLFIASATASAVIAVGGLIILLHFIVNKKLKGFEVHLRHIAQLRGDGTRMPVLGSDELDLFASKVNVVLDALEDAKAEAVAANEAKSLFVASVSHELRTPLHGILGMLHILLRDEKSPLQRDRLKMAWEAGYRLRFLIDDLLDLAKIEAGKLELNYSDINVKHTLREALVAVAARGLEKGVEIFGEIAPSTPRVIHNDALRIAQILINLLGNGAKFTDSGFVACRISFDPTTSELLVSIEDTGVGTPADKLEKIFDVYGQADASTAANFGGTGLGLSISKQLISMMSGSMAVTSSVGQGTEFILRIPVTNPMVPEDTPLQLTGKEVLIAITNPCFRAELAASLAARGASSHVLDHPDDLFILDSQELIRPLDAIILDGDLLEQLPEHERVVAEERLSQVAREQIWLISPMQSFLHPTGEEASSRRVLLRPLIVNDVIDALLGKEISIATRLKSETEQWQVEVDNDRPLHILVADDSRTNRVILEEMLSEKGHQVISVANGEQLVHLHRLLVAASAATERELCDIVFTDIEMPGLDGITAAQLMRNQCQCFREGGATLPIVALTAHAQSEKREQLLVSGVSEVLTKPLIPKALFAAIRTLTHQRDTLSKEDPRFDIYDVITRASGISMRVTIRLEGFVQDAPAVAEILRKGASSGNREDMQHAAHTLKGLCREVGGATVAQVLEDIERDAFVRPLTELETLVTMALEDIDYLVDLLGRILQNVDTMNATLSRTTSPRGPGESGQHEA